MTGPRVRERKPRDGRERNPHADPKDRMCLRCRKPFPSEWNGERTCRKCKDRVPEVCVDDVEFHGLPNVNSGFWW